jgi:antitoxin CptB
MANDDLDLRRRRCLFRATHRGTKEMDWLLGRYAEVALPAVDAGGIAFWEELVQIPDPQFHDWIMGAEVPDERIGAVVREIQRFHGMA